MGCEDVLGLMCQFFSGTSASSRVLATDLDLFTENGMLQHSSPASPPINILTALRRSFDYDCSELNRLVLLREICSVIINFNKILKPTDHSRTLTYKSLDSKSNFNRPSET